MLKSTTNIFYPAAMALSLPIILAADKNEKAPKGRFVKPSNLPIYEGREDLNTIEYHGKEKTQFQEGITVVRKEVESVLEATLEVREAVSKFFETGKAHSLGSLSYIQDEDNLSAKIGVISAGTLIGLLFGIRKGFFRKIIYTSIGAGGAASACYPDEAVKYSNDFVKHANAYGTIGYNFVTGVKPKDFLNELKSITEVKQKSDAKTDEPPPMDKAAEKSSPSSPAEVSPSSKSSFESLLQASSDIMLWGFRLKSSPEENFFISPNTSETTEISESVEEAQSDYNKESFDRDKIKHELEEDTGNKGSELIKDIAIDTVALVAANVINEVAEQVVKITSKIARTADSVETVSDRVESVAEIVETIGENVSDLPLIPSSVVKMADKVEIIAGSVDDIAETVGVISSGVSDFADSIKKVASNIEKKTDDYIEVKIDDIKENFEDLIEHKLDQWKTSSILEQNSASSNNEESTTGLNGNSIGLDVLKQHSNSPAAVVFDNESRTDQMELMEDFWINAMLRAQKEHMETDSKDDSCESKEFKKLPYKMSGRDENDLPPIFVGSDNKGVMSDDTSDPNFISDDTSDPNFISDDTSDENFISDDEQLNLPSHDDDSQPSAVSENQSHIIEADDQSSVSIAAKSPFLERIRSMFISNTPVVNENVLVDPELHPQEPETPNDD